MLLLSAFGTSVLSSMFGMAGGLILMGILSATMPVAAAMVLHGATQVVANGVRVLLWYKHVHWGVLGWYALGALGALVILQVISMVPPVWLVFLGLGLMPWVSRLTFLRPPSVTDGWWSPTLAGLLVCLVQGMAGVAGPILDLFFVEAQLSRQEVVATKAVTQVLSHLVKLGVFLSILDGNIPVSPWLLIAMGGMAVLGTGMGAWVLERMSEAWFRQASQWLISGVGMFYLVKAGQLLWG